MWCFVCEEGWKSAIIQLSTFCSSGAPPKHSPPGPTTGTLEAALTDLTRSWWGRGGGAGASHRCFPSVLSVLKHWSHTSNPAPPQICRSHSVQDGCKQRLSTGTSGVPSTKSRQGSNIGIYAMAQDFERTTWSVKAAAGEPLAVISVRDFQTITHMCADAWGRQGKEQPILVTAELSTLR